VGGLEKPVVAANLPALATSQGGALVAVLQWPQYLKLLDQVQQTRIAILVRSFPDLNTETGVDMLADAMLFYKVRFDAWFAELLEAHGIETITMVLELLREYSVVGGIDDVEEADAAEQPKPAVQDDRERLELECGLELVSRLRQLGKTVDTFEQCESLLNWLGGWEVARLVTYELLEAFSRGDLDLAELREIVAAPHESVRGDDEDETHWR